MECFKPLRNYLKKYNITSMLRAVWHLSSHLEYQNDLPPYLVQANPQNKNPMELPFFLWQLDTLSREAILYCDIKAGKPVKSWPDIRNALIKLRDAEDRAYTVSDETLLSEVARIAHRQVHWQQGISLDHISRMRKLYRHPEMDNIVRHVYGLSTDQVAQGGFSAVAVYLSHSAIGPDWSKSVDEVLGYDTRKLIQNLTADYPTLRKMARELRSLDENWAYAFNPLWQYPLITVSDEITVCPIPGLLIRRITEGLYFDVIGEDPNAMSAHLGPAFQSYVGEVIERAASGNYVFLPEERYGPKKAIRDTVDWIVSDDSGSLFVEVKLLKMGRAAKEQLAPHEAVKREFGKMAKAVGQIYATLSEARDGKYPTWKPNGLPVYPVVVTLDDWNLFSHTTYSLLADMVRDELVRRDLDPNLVDTNRYVICSIAEFEHGIQVIDEVGIARVMEGLTTGDKAGWLLSNYINCEFHDLAMRPRNLFPEERKSLMPQRPPK